MKKLLRPVIIFGVSLILTRFSVSFSQLTRPAMLGDFSAAAFFQQTTPTPQVEDVSEIGSTDEIIVLGGVIALIVIVPIFLYRKSWMHTSSS